MTFASDMLSKSERAGSEVKWRRAQSTKDFRQMQTLNIFERTYTALILLFLIDTSENARTVSCK